MKILICQMGHKTNPLPADRTGSAECKQEERVSGQKAPDKGRGRTVGILGRSKPPPGGGVTLIPRFATFSAGDFI